MEKHAAENELPTQLVRYEFGASGHLRAIVNGFLQERAKNAPVKYYSAKNALLTETEFYQHAHDGTFKRLTQMAENLETVLYPSGELQLKLSQQALQLTFLFEASPLEAVRQLGDRLENLDNPALGPSLGIDGVYTQIPRAYSAEEHEIEATSERFRTVMSDEFQRHHYFLKPTKLVFPKLP